MKMDGTWYGAGSVRFPCNSITDFAFMKKTCQEKKSWPEKRQPIFWVGHLLSLVKLLGSFLAFSLRRIVQQRVFSHLVWMWYDVGVLKVSLLHLRNRLDIRYKNNIIACLYIVKQIIAKKLKPLVSFKSLISCNSILSMYQFSTSH